MHLKSSPVISCFRFDLDRKWNPLQDINGFYVCLVAHVHQIITEIRRFKFLDKLLAVIFCNLKTSLSLLYPVSCIYCIDGYIAQNTLNREENWRLLKGPSVGGSH